ncbi:MAG TPA: TnsA-like heteromeric transposase endonuclease subunit, partial [Mycobacterium sp.]|nr:TnsA-like heteromeric transposase endonuclease subunit [Mycobacterium sp.]
MSVVRGGASASPAGREFEIAYVDAESGERRLALIDAWSVPFEECMPVRGFPSYKGQRNHVGRWWTATTGSLVGYESWLERDWLMLLDFDPDVVGIAAQPFWLLWTTPEGKPCSHAPDYFARSAGGAALVMDCRPADRIKSRDADAFAVTRAACELVGWRYEVAGSPVPVVVGNVRWLSGYRHPRHDLPDVAAALQAAFAAPTGLMAGAESVGDPIAVLPVLFHLLWCHRLHADLSVPLSPDGGRGGLCTGSVGDALMGLARPVLRVGDRVVFDGDEHQVVGLSGTSVRLRADSGVQQVVLAGHLMAAADFTVLDAPMLSSVVPHGLLEALPAEAVAAAERWREHVVEVETGLSPDAPPGARPHEGYDPAMTSLAERQRAKAAELGVSV